MSRWQNLPDEWRRYFKRSLYVMLSAGVVAILWDIYFASSGEAPAWLITWSGVTKYAGWIFPFVAFGTTGLTGHFHVNLGSALRELGVATGWNGQLLDKPLNYYVLAGMCTFFVAAALYWRIALGGPAPAFVSIVSGWLGYWTGALLWPQRGPESDPRLS